MKMKKLYVFKKWDSLTNDETIKDRKVIREGSKIE